MDFPSKNEIVRELTKQFSLTQNSIAIEKLNAFVQSDRYFEAFEEASGEEISERMLEVAGEFFGKAKTPEVWMVDVERYWDLDPEVKFNVTLYYDGHTFRLSNNSNKPIGKVTLIEDAREVDYPIFGVNIPLFGYGILSNEYSIYRNPMAKPVLSDEEIKALVLERGLTITRLIDVVVDLNGFVGVGLISLGDDLKAYCSSKIRRG